MSRWADIVDAAPEFAERVRSLFQARKHKTLATLRRDGSPRISGIETQFEEGDLWFGMMPDSVKALDLRRDPRLALHSPTVDPPEGHEATWPGEAKIAGVAIETDGRFRVDITEVVLTSIAVASCSSRAFGSLARVGQPKPELGPIAAASRIVRQA